MRKTKTFVFNLLLGFILSSSAHALSVTPVDGNYSFIDNTTVSGPTIYFPVLGSGVCATARTYPSSLGRQDTSTGFLAFDIRTEVPLTSTPGATSTYYVRAETVSGTTTTGTGVPLTSHLPADATLFNYGTTDGVTQRVNISLGDTSAPVASGICNGTVNCTPGPAAGPTSFQVQFGIVNDTTTAVGSSQDKSSIITIILVDCPPHDTTSLTLPAVNFTLTPGDSRVRMKNISTAPIDSAGGIPISQLVVFGGKNRTPTTQDFDLSAGGLGLTGDYELSNLENDREYCFALGYVNRGGYLATVSGTTQLPPGNNGGTSCAIPSQVDGFLNRSTCFIASVAYGTELDSRLEILREFRDQVLLRNRLGSKFVDWYYSWSPGAAKWAYENPAVLPVFRVLLWPVVRGAQFMLWLSHQSLLSNAYAQDTANDVQPYIEQLKQKNHIKPRPWVSNPPAGSESAVVRPSENLPTVQEQVTTPHIDELKRKADAQYATEPRKDPSDSSSAESREVQPYIEALKSDKELQPRYKGPIKHAAGIAVVASDNWNVTSTEAQANSFESVYQTDSRYNPGVDVFYEYEVLRDRNFGALGIGGDLKFLFAKGKGIFTKRGGTSDDTVFKFMALPTSLTATYRFTLPRFFTPFVKVGATAIPFLETRSDPKDNRKSLSYGSTVALGAGLSLDWISRKNAWERYDEHGILHTYLVLQREFVNTFSGPVKFSYNAWFAGLAFEY